MGQLMKQIKYKKYPLSYSGFKMRLLKLGDIGTKIECCETIFTLPSFGDRRFYLFQFEVIVYVCILHTKNLLSLSVAHM